MTAALRATALLTAMALASCATPPPPSGPTPGAPAPSGSMTAPQLLTAVQADADRMAQSKDAAERTQLLDEATARARQCLLQFPDNGGCQYAQAQVQGLTAQAKPLEATSLLKAMLASLGKAEAQDPALDHAGPARLTAIVLLRAPPWPLGPGDVDAALSAAQRAVKRDPAYPPNLITLAQAQEKSLGVPPARATLAQAQQATKAWTGGPGDAPAHVTADRTKWQQDIAQELHDLQ